MQRYFHSFIDVGQGASKGALRCAVLEAQGAAIASADIVAIWVETGIRDHSAAGLADNFLSLDSIGYYQRQALSSYPNSAFDCQHGSVTCILPAALQHYASAEVDAFAPDFRTPRAQYGSINSEKEVGGRITGKLSYLLCTAWI